MVNRHEENTCSPSHTRLTLLKTLCPASGSPVRSLHLSAKKPAPVWRSGLPTEWNPSGHPGESHNLDIPRFPFIGLLVRAVPPTGTEMEARPFGPDPEIATGATPEPTDAARKRGFRPYPGSTSLHFPSFIG